MDPDRQGAGAAAPSSKRYAAQSYHTPQAAPQGLRPPGVHISHTYTR